MEFHGFDLAVPACISIVYQSGGQYQCAIHCGLFGEYHHKPHISSIERTLTGWQGTNQFGNRYAYEKYF